MIKDSDVHDLLLGIPAGKVSTYGDLAKALGNPSESREIGTILDRNPNRITVPCHRVVMSNGNNKKDMKGSPPLIVKIMNIKLLCKAFIYIQLWI